MIDTQYEIGKEVAFKYPARGRLNTLRNVTGKVVENHAEGDGPNGPYITVEQDNGETRSFSLKKIVNM